MTEHNNHPHNRQVINRMARIIGHTEAVKRMIEEGKECDEILVQISAVRAALNSVGKIILEDHINHCIIEAVENNDKGPLEKLNKAIDKFIK